MKNRTNHIVSTLKQQEQENSTLVKTTSGNLIDLLNPNPDAICLSDIAYSLSGINRYLAHGTRTIDVASHSIFVCNAVMQIECATAIDGFHALIHDAHEAYTGDIIAPVKNITGMKEILKPVEDSIQRAIEKRFGVGEPSKKTKEMIRFCDLLVRDLEMMAIWPDKDGYPLFTYEDRNEARFAFIKHFKEFGLRSGIKKELFNSFNFSAQEQINV